MAFKKLEQKEALKIETAGEIIGYLMAVKIKTHQGDQKDSYIYTLQGKASGEIFEMWGTGAINSRLIIGDGIPPQFKGCLFKFTYLGKKKLPGKPSPMHDVGVEMDDEDRIKV